VSSSSLAVSWLFILASGCASLPPPYVNETHLGTIEAVSEDVGERTWQVLEEFDPRVRAFLGTSQLGIPTVKIGLNTTGEIPNADGFANSEGVVVRTVLEGWERLLIHELVHWHATRHWDTLPYVVEEVIAQTLSWSSWRNRNRDSGWIATVSPPLRQTLLTALKLSYHDFYSVDEDASRGECEMAGLWIVATLGMEGLKALACKAQERGHSKIPAEWIVQALPDSWTPAEMRSEDF
jgi:hypothetical protein